ncbi:SNF2 family DNA or RNA helicase [Leeuwenhoekiella aestuarii]|uniref:DEAD/DEAH box helicase n=1 Tax=Leeuwenhoekiella aestuarii TaxID=2249426 RepID=UPI0010274EF6|nr:DEAD/DEAH box helicase [Leeuwenhoekiella aestuarii]RXG19121.1 SNF2 family DNA or RNA helicase [Leeuwenhoekiella aestuarii]
MQLNISINNESKYSVTGAIKELLNNRRSKMLLRTKLSYEIEDKTLIINSDDPIERVAELLSLAAKYINAEVNYDTQINSDIKLFREKELQFEEFTSKAKDIKANNCITEDFDNFTNVLIQNMTERRLYPLQLLSAYHLAFSQSGCNFSVPGAGKTSIVYGAYTYLKNLPTDNPKKIDKIIIIGPLSSFGPWELEFEECFGRKVNCKRINGSISAENKKQYFYGQTAELILISYASVVSIKESIQYFLSNHKVMVVLDEAHKIKNTSGGIISSSILELANLCTSRVVLTGTPVPNGYEDLYNLFNFIWPKRNVTEYNVGQLRDMSTSINDDRVNPLMSNIDPYYIRIKKGDLNIPKPVENAPILVQMGESQQRVYDFIEKRFVDEINNSNTSLHSSLVKAKLIRLQQVASNPALLKESLNRFAEENYDNFNTIEKEDSLIMQDVMRYYSDEIPAKFIKCAELVNQIIEENGKVVIWAIFIKTIESLQNYLSSVGVESRTLYGATPVATDGMTPEDINYELTREAIISEFHNADCSYNVIIANPFAVAESISLHKVCHNAIYIERSFNCAHFIQSKDRIHRYGLPEDTITNYYYLLSRNTVDEVIDNRLKIKEERMLALIESSPIPLFDNIGDEGNEDIKAIILDYVKRKNRIL